MQAVDAACPTVAVTSVEVVGTRAFGVWLRSVSYPTWVSVIASIARLASFGRSLGDPEVEILTTATCPVLYRLVPQPPAIGTQVVFGFDPSERVVLLEGGRRFEKAMRPWRILVRHRSPRRWYRLVASGELLPLEQLAGPINSEDRAEINAARDNAALLSVLSNEAAMGEARRKRSHPRRVRTQN